MSRYEYNASKVTETIYKLKQAQAKVDNDFISQVNSAINTIKGARGASDLQVNLDGIPTFATEISNTLVSLTSMINEKAQMIEDYNNAWIGKKLWNSGVMSLSKLFEGFLTGIENIGDGLLSLGGELCSVVGLTGASNALFDFAGKDLVGGAFYEAYENGILSGVNKYSLFDHSSKGASIIRSIGVAGSYLTAGWLTGGTTLSYTAVAGLGGLGSGTQLGLMSGQSNSEAFKTGLKSGLRDAAAMFLGTKLTGYAIGKYLTQGGAAGTEALVVAGDSSAVAEGSGVLSKVIGPLQGVVAVPIASDEIAKEAARSAGSLGKDTIPGDLNFDTSNLDTTYNGDLAKIDDGSNSESDSSSTLDQSSDSSSEGSSWGYYTPSSEEPATETPTTKEEPSTVTPTTKEEPSTVTPTTKEEPSTVTPTTKEEPSTVTPSRVNSKPIIKPTSSVKDQSTDVNEDEPQEEIDEESMYRTDFVIDPRSRNDVPWDEIIDISECPVVEPETVIQEPIIETPTYIDPIIEQPVVNNNNGNSNDALKVVGGIAAAAGIVAAGVGAKKLVDKKDENEQNEQYDDGYYAPVSENENKKDESEEFDEDSDENFYVKY